MTMSISCCTVVEAAAPLDAAAMEPASSSGADPAAGQMKGDGTGGDAAAGHSAAQGSAMAAVQRQAFAMDSNVQLVALAAAALLGDVRRGAAAGTALPDVAAGPSTAVLQSAAMPATPDGTAPDAPEVLHRASRVRSTVFC